MRQLFFIILGGALIVSVLAWALFMFGRALWDVFRDWRLGRELDQLEAEASSRRQQRQRMRAERLATGCAHDFDGGVIGLPPHVCTKCGVEKEKPTGGCDHVWRVKPGKVPCSECERCGKRYNPLEPAQLDRK